MSDWELNLNKVSLSDFGVLKAFFVSAYDTYEDSRKVIEANLQKVVDLIENSVINSEMKETEYTKRYSNVVHLEHIALKCSLNNWYLSRKIKLYQFTSDGVTTRHG